jgi:Leucine-rich repeat (LRR) protein
MGCRAVLRTLPRLESLDLSHTQIDAFELLDLRELKSLRQLTLSGVNLTTAQVQNLREALPDCRFVAAEPSGE